MLNIPNGCLDYLTCQRKKTASEPIIVKCHSLLLFSQFVACVSSKPYLRAYVHVFLRRLVAGEIVLVSFTLVYTNQGTEEGRNLELAVRNVPTAFIADASLSVCYSPSV